VVDEMQVDINLSNIILGLLISLISLITWFLKQAVDHLRTQIKSLHDADNEMSKEIRSLDKNSITREEMRQLIKEHNESVEKSLSAIFRKLDNLEAKK
jgi:septal ring factor EnvC (AmiA/AmiB activator)